MRVLPFAGLVCLILLCAPWVAAGSQPPEPPDAIEQATGLKRLGLGRFVVNLKYNSEDNFLKRNVYAGFGLASCYVHPELYVKLEQLERLLEGQNLTLLVYDCYRPLEVQKAMWASLPDSRYVANPQKGSLHNRGVAIDCALGDENGVALPFPTGFDSFEQKSWQNYQCKAGEEHLCVNREQLNSLMRRVGLSSITSEWWHFQLPGAKKFPLLSLEP